MRRFGAGQELMHGLGQIPIFPSGLGLDGFQIRARRE
jgi:hypothetical protein